MVLLQKLNRKSPNIVFEYLSSLASDQSRITFPLVQAYQHRFKTNHHSYINTRDVRRLDLNDTLSYAGCSPTLLEGSPLPNRSKGKNQTKSDPLVLQLEVGRRVNDPAPQKETRVTEAGCIDDTTQTEGVATGAITRRSHHHDECEGEESLNGMDVNLHEDH